MASLEQNRPFSLLIKPASADCNLNCKYCFYLGHSALYPETKKHRMSTKVLEKMISSYMSTEQQVYAFGWQGGEPTLMGVDFFRKAVEFQKKYGQQGKVVSNGLQTNAILINDEFAQHLSKYHFLLGVSLDGPSYIHDHYRKYVNEHDTHAYVMKSIDCLKQNNVEFNILTLVNNINVKKAKEVYHYLCDNGFLFHQYIECVEFDEKGNPLPYTVKGEEWGCFLCEIYDEWIKTDTRKVSVRLFDSILNYLVENIYIVCKMNQNCCQYFVVEYNGDVYPCDFFVEKELEIGNVIDGTWEEFLKSSVYLEFGKQKALWNDRCRECEYITYCSGDCLKERFYGKKDPQQLSWLCKGWKMFFKHALPGLKELARGIRQERMEQVEIAKQQQMSSPPDPSISQKKIGRNDPCPCGSGKKYKNCCLNK